MYPRIQIKKGRQSSVLTGHPWIFTGALKRPENPVEHGAPVQVIDEAGTVIATGTYSARTSIAVRVFAFSSLEITASWLKARIEEADSRRKLLGFGLGPADTAYRLVFGESDGLPGLVVDRFGEVLVMQIATAGMDRLRPLVLECLVDLFSPVAIYEKSDSPSRTEEGLPPVAACHHGSLPDPVIFQHGGARYVADIVQGQKSGFFLDQRNLRLEIGRLASGRSVADVFSYTGSAGLTALRSGAANVVFVDSSERALDLCRQHAVMNDVSEDRISTEEADVFQWLGSQAEPRYDLMILDPPALIKSRKHIDQGRKGYHFINRAALRLLRDGGILVTSSCSVHFTMEDMRVTLRRAAMQLGVDLHLLMTVGQSEDHPVALNFPESAYLKSFICQVKRP